MTCPLVHVLEPIHPEALDALSQHTRVLGPEVPFPSECDAVIVRAKPISAADIAACPNLRVIGKHGAGLDAIDVAEARARGIPVVSTPGANAESVADLAIGLSLALLRGIHPATLAMQAGQSFAHRGFDLSEMQIGIFGLGAIGRATARRAMAGFGAPVAAFDPGIAKADWPDAITRCPTLEALLERSTLLIIHAPLIPATRDNLNAERLALLPRGAFVVNCARGGIVDEAALAEALSSGHLAGAASDVFAQEPPAPDNPLLKQPNFLATPHLGGNTNGALRRVGHSVVAQVLHHLGIKTTTKDHP